MEASFFRQYSVGKSELDLLQLIEESLRPSFNFVRNNPVNGIDMTGLDRWLIHNIHSAVVVAVWDKCCARVVGYKRVEFGPTSGWVYSTLGLVWPGQVTITDASKPSGWNVWRYQTGCDSDQALLNWALKEQKNPPYYSLYFYNCDDFAEELLMIDFPEGGPLPWPRNEGTSKGEPIAW